MIPSYHIWLMPLSKAYALLSATITELSLKHNAPRFEPHVTLLGDLPGLEQGIVAKMSLLVRQVNSYDIHLTNPAHDDQYFRCLFLNVQETALVMEANAKAKVIFSKAESNDIPYRPHLSLLYGNYSVSLKTQIIATLPSFQGLSFAVTSLHLVRAESTNPKDWHKIAEFPLNG